MTWLLMDVVSICCSCSGINSHGDNSKDNIVGPVALRGRLWDVVVDGKDPADVTTVDSANILVVVLAKRKSN